MLFNYKYSNKHLSTILLISSPFLVVSGVGKS